MAYIASTFGMLAVFCIHTTSWAYSINSPTEGQVYHAGKSSRLAVEIHLTGTQYVSAMDVTKNGVPFHFLPSDLFVKEWSENTDVKLISISSHANNRFAGSTGGLHTLPDTLNTISVRISVSDSANPSLPPIDLGTQSVTYFYSTN